MAILVILVLAIMWAAVLLPPILRARADGAGGVSGVSDFFSRLREGLGRGRVDPSLPPLQPIMGPIGAAPIGNGHAPDPAMAPIGPVRVPGAMSPAQRRRRDVLIGLLAFAGIMLLMGLMSGSVIVWVLQLLADAMLGGYVFLLLRLKARTASRRPQPQPRPQPRPLMAPATPALPNVHDLTARRFPPATTVAPNREAKVLALRRSVSW